MIKKAKTKTIQTMKKIYSLFALILVSTLAFGEGITFEHGSFNQALAKAKAENKLLFIDGYAVWCGPCKYMAATVFMEDTVGKYFDQHLIALKVDVERGEGPDIKRRYGISGLPGYVFIDGEGNVVYRFEASMSTEKFLENVALAVHYSKDTNSIGRLAERYPNEKDNEQFVRLYLDKLHESNSTGYTDVLEQYLHIQKSITEDSKEMVVLLANHAEEIVYGGLADSIIQRNYGSDAWKLYVRKDIREVFQKLPRMMVENTTDYAVEKKDTAILELVLSRAEEAGATVDEAQRKRTYIFYYLKSGNGEKYKALVHDDNDAYIESVDAENLREYYIKWKQLVKDGDKEAMALRPHSVRTSQQISAMVFSYAPFVESQQDKNDVLRWMKVAYDIIPGDPQIMSQYANILYLFGDDKAEAIEIKKEAMDVAMNEDIKRKDGIKADLDLMIKGEEIVLK